jgi:hypothetical protein
MTATLRLSIQGFDLRGAVISADGLYRYSLKRAWEPDGIAGGVLFIMLNPSTADGEQDDPTIRRCIAYAKAWGAHGLEVVNLFAFRATDPDELLRTSRPIGPENDAAIRDALTRAGLVVAAWGTHEAARGRDRAVTELVTRTHDLHALALSNDGHPKHPLYLRKSLQPVIYRRRSS